MQAQIIPEKQLVEKDQIKMYTFGLKVVLLQKKEMMLAQEFKDITYDET